MVIDDNADVCEALALVLGMRGIQVTTAASGFEGLAKLRDGIRPCVLFLDVRMPDMDGWMVWDQMRADVDLVTIPVVILTGESIQRERPLRVGIREVLIKPIDTPRVLDTVDRHCRAEVAAAAAARPKPERFVG
jgi:CheY-like chemotaxis protein